MPPIPSHLSHLPLKTVHFTHRTRTHLAGTERPASALGRGSGGGHREPTMPLLRQRWKPSEWGQGARMPESFCPSKSSRCLSGSFPALFIYYKYIFYKLQLLLLPCRPSSFHSPSLGPLPPPWATVDRQAWLAEGPGTGPWSLGAGEGSSGRGCMERSWGLGIVFFPPCI